MCNWFCWAKFKLKHLFQARVAQCDSHALNLMNQQESNKWKTFFFRELPARRWLVSQEQSTLRYLNHTNRAVKRLVIVATSYPLPRIDLNLLNLNLSAGLAESERQLSAHFSCLIWIWIRSWTCLTLSLSLSKGDHQQAVNWWGREEMRQETM